MAGAASSESWAPIATWEANSGFMSIQRGASVARLVLHIATDNLVPLDRYAPPLLTDAEGAGPAHGCRSL